MTIEARKPPYSEADLDDLASLFAARRAWGCFYGSPTFQRVFGRALANHNRASFLGELEGGAIYAWGFAKPGKTIPNGAEPRFKAYAWLDAVSVHALVRRLRTSGALAGELGELPSTEEFTKAVRDFDTARELAIRDLKGQVRA